MLGWKILDEGEYEVDLRKLSQEEENLILRVEEKFKEKSRLEKISDSEDAKELIKGLVLECAEDAELYLSDSQSRYISKSAFYHVYGYGFISCLLADGSIEEISIVGPNKPAYVYIRNVGWKTVNATFTEESKISEMINKMSAKIGRRITLQNPRINAVLPDGSRLHASLSPISKGEVTIRKFRENPFSPAELCANGTITKDAMAFLSLVMQGDFSVVFAGNTASGKTTTLNSLFSFVPLNERIVITEETPEINVPHPQVVSLVSNGEMGVFLKDLVYDSLRMRPDRLIVGEVRNRNEVEALFDVLLGGQARGSYATFHAQSGNEAVQRFKSFGISDADLPSIDILIVQRRLLYYDQKKRRNTEIRRVVEISEITKNGAQPVFHRSGSDLVFNKKSSFYERICSDLNISVSELKSEMLSREKLFSSQNFGFSRFISKAQKELYGLRYEID